MRSLLTAVALSAVLAAAPQSLASQAKRGETPKLPTRALLVQGESLAGIRLGDPASRVRELWGHPREYCKPSICPRPTWLYMFEGFYHGAAVTFDRGRVAAVFTLGSPLGWQTTEGLRIGEDMHVAVKLYPWKSFRRCIGYAAISRRSGDIVTSIYTFGDIVYGFALTRHTEPVCQ